jgi:hypothetical protein
MYLLNAIQCLGGYAGPDKDNGGEDWHYPNDDNNSSRSIKYSITRLRMNCYN